MADETVTINVKGLEQILKALKAKPPVARIGILGATPHAPKPGQKAPKHAPTTAEIGAVHEFGSPARGIPQRSFLRVPIAENLDKELENSGVLNENRLKEVIKGGSVLPWMEDITNIAQKIVLEAFASQGFGKWAPWKTKGYTNNANMILVDSGQLRDSITTEVKP